MPVPVTDPTRKRELEEQLRLACELHDLGVQLMRQNLCRRNPGASETEIEEPLRAWLHESPRVASRDPGS